MFYRNSIILLGLFVPGLLCAALIFGSASVRTKTDQLLLEKQAAAKKVAKERLEIITLETSNREKRTNLDRWNQQLAQETAKVITSNLHQISKVLPTREFEQTSFVPTATKGGLAAASAQNSSQIQLTFQGTFRSVQQGLLELETRMPQLQLQELKITPDATSASTMRFEIAYTAWEK
jgi:hypothetical protein